MVEQMPGLVRSARVRIVALATISFALTACGNGPSVATLAPPSTTRVIATPPPVAGAGSCRNPSDAHDTRHGIEITGTTTDHEPLTMLFAGTHHSIPAGKALSTFVRVGGARALRLSVIDTKGHADRVRGFRPGVPSFDWPGGRAMGGHPDVRDGGMLAGLRPARRAHGRALAPRAMTHITGSLARRGRTGARSCLIAAPAASRRRQSARRRSRSGWIARHRWTDVARGSHRTAPRIRNRKVCASSPTSLLSHRHPS
jgi:hypothetical protein